MMDGREGRGRRDEDDEFGTNLHLKGRGRREGRGMANLCVQTRPELRKNGGAKGRSRESPRTKMSRELGGEGEGHSLAHFRRFPRLGPKYLAKLRNLWPQKFKQM